MKILKVKKTDLGPDKKYSKQQAENLLKRIEERYDSLISSVRTLQLLVPNIDSTKEAKGELSGKMDIFCRKTKDLFDGVKRAVSKL